MKSGVIVQNSNILIFRYPAGQLLKSDSCHHIMIEALGCLCRSLDLRVTYLGSLLHQTMDSCSEFLFCLTKKYTLVIHVLCMTSWQLLIFCSLLREIEQIWSRRCWPQGGSQQYSEDSRNGTSLWEHLLKLNYHSAQSSNTVSSAMCTNADKLQRAKSVDLASYTISDKSKGAEKGKRFWDPLLPFLLRKRPNRRHKIILKCRMAQKKKHRREKKIIAFRLFL